MVVVAGMLKTTQCHQPLPVGASGSYIVTAKLLVSAGAPFQLRAGEMLPPEQPKLLYTCSLAILPRALNSGLTTVKDAACVADAASRPSTGSTAVNFLFI